MPNILIILDGIQDIAYEQLGGKTPLEAGKGTAWAEIERSAATARLVTTPDGFEPDTQVCTLTLLGIAEADMPAGRSCLEALAEGVAVGKQDMILRCNFVKISDDGKLEVPCYEAPDELAAALMEAVGAEYGAALKRIGTYKCLQTVPGARESIHGITTFPPHNYQNYALADVLPRGNRLAERFAATTLRLLEQHRPYTVLNWAPSIYEEVAAFEALHGKRGGMVTKTLVLEGIGKIMGMTTPELPGCTGDTDTDLGAKARATLELLAEHEFVLLHVGGTDEATHRQNAAEKAEFIAKIDEELLAPILAGVPEGTRIMLTCDHAALCSTAGHTAEPVAALLYQKGAAASGDLGELDGKEAVPVLCSGSWAKKL